MDPLQTDEKLAIPKSIERDMDTHMLFGCSGFVAASFATYFLSAWPFFVWLDIHFWPQLAKSLGFGFPFAFLLGAIFTLKFELAGAAGFIGGMMASCIFLYLRFEQMFLEAQAQRIPEPPYPHWLQWFAPITLIVAALLMSAVILVFLPGRVKTSI